MTSSGSSVSNGEKMSRNTSGKSWKCQKNGASWLMGSISRLEPATSASTSASLPPASPATN